MSDHIVFCPDFNPRSREGSDFASRSHKHPRQISIHAPAKGATMMSWCWGKAIRFQSTLPRRERHRNTKSKVEKFYFNPRSREGSDNEYKKKMGLTTISIHAPAKGATNGRDMVYAKRVISIHAPAKGATTILPEGRTICTFQSTLPRRERRQKNNPLPLILYFNPRSREGSDEDRITQKKALIISIHAPAKGATAFINIFSLAVRLFFISSHQ